MSEGEAALRMGRETLAGVRERTEVSRGHRRPRAGSARRGRACTVRRWRLSERRRELGGSGKMKVSPPLLPLSVTIRVRRKEEREGAGLARSRRLTGLREGPGVRCIRGARPSVTPQPSR